MSKGNIKEFCLKKLSEIENIQELKGINGFEDELNSLKTRMNDNEFRIAVVGEFSSGKSTFINALLKKDILKHATTETTATLTRIVNVSSKDKKAYTAKVFLSDEKTITLKNLQDLQDYTTTNSKQYKVVDDIKYVEIYFPLMNNNKNVVIVDTPGLNGVADGHREQTISIIQKAHACVYLLQRRGLTNSDIEFLDYIKQYQRNFIIVQNFIDEFRKMEGESVKVKLEEQEQILKEKIFLSDKSYHYDICGVSALKELASSDNSIKYLYSEDDKVLTKEDRLRLHVESNFDEYRKILDRRFNDESLSKIQYGDTAWAIYDWIKNLIRKINDRNERLQEVYEASKDKGAIQKLDQLKEKVQRNIDRELQHLENFICAQCISIKKENKSVLEDKFVLLSRNINAEIDRCNKIEDLEGIQKTASSNLEGSISKLRSSIYDDLKLRFDVLCQLLLQRIEEYSSIKVKDFKFDDLKVNSVVRKVNLYGQEDSIKEDQRHLYYLESCKSDMIKDLRQNFSDVDGYKNKCVKISSDISFAYSYKKRCLYDLGDRPEPIEHVEYKSRGGLFGWLRSKIEVRTTDDSKGEEWDRNRNYIESESANKIAELEKQRDAAKRQMERLQKRCKDNNDRIQRVEYQINDLKQRIRIQKETLERKKIDAAREYLALSKRNLKESIDKYIYGEKGIKEQSLIDLDSTIQESEKKLNNWAKDKFLIAIGEKLQWIEDCKQKESPVIYQQINKIKDVQRNLDKLKKDMEVYLK